MNRSKRVFLIFLSLSLILGSYVYNIYKNYAETNMLSNMDMLKTRIERAIESVFFDVDLLEALIVYGYDKLDDEALNILLKPILNQAAVRNLSFVPNGIVESIYPLKGNEKAIGDNIYTMPGREIEAQLAIETKDIILSGPYTLTQGGTALIARKAVFLPDESGKKELWGFVAIVINIPHIMQSIDFTPPGIHTYEYELSAIVNGIGKVEIIRSDNFNTEKAQYVDIILPNGKWQLGLNKISNIFEVASLMMLFMSALLASIIIYQILEKKEKQLALLEEKLYIDPLTGIFNRKKLEIIEEQSIYLQQPYAVFYMDLNDFKQINDTHGHETGDDILKAFTQRSKKIIKENDLLIRIGGDEFILVLFNISNERDVKKFCERLKSHISEKLILNKVEFVMTVSIGFARYPLEGATLPQLVSLADSRMYEDKKNKNKIVPTNLDESTPQLNLSSTLE